MDVKKTIQTGLSDVIDQLQKQRDELFAIYHTAINKGEKFVEVKTLYIRLQEVDKKLNDLMRVCF